MASRFSVRRVPDPDVAPRTVDVGAEAVAPVLQLTEAVADTRANPLLSEKLLDAKVRLHRRLIEDINLSALEKLPEEEIRGHVQHLVSQYVLAERLALNAQELA